MQPPEVRRQRRQLFVIVALSILFASAFLLVLMIITGWGYLAMFGVVAGFIVLGALHYLIWGRSEEQAAHRVGSTAPVPDAKRPLPGTGTDTR